VNYKDIANKIALVKNGRVFKKGVLPDLDDPNSDGIPNEIIANEADYLNIYQDRKREIYTHAINYKHVFSIWST